MPADTSNYIGEMASQLAVVARTQKLHVLAYLLDMVVLEARLAIERKMARL